MTAAIGSAANLNTGMLQSSMITNSYGGYLISAGAAHDLVLPFQADKLEWWNYSKFGTDANNLFGVWFRDFPANDALIVSRGTTTLSSALEASNGVDIADVPPAFQDEHKIINNITAAAPGVVTTSTNHGYVDGDRVVITKVIGSLGSSVNNQTFVVKYVSANQFSLYDIYGAPVVTSGTYTSGGQSTLTGPKLGIKNSQPVYMLTLGSAVMGANGDKIYFVAYKFNSYYNLGQV